MSILHWFRVLITTWSQFLTYLFSNSPNFHCRFLIWNKREGGRERRREGGREGWREGGREGEREREREGGREGGNCKLARFGAVLQNARPVYHYDTVIEAVMCLRWAETWEVSLSTNAQRRSLKSCVQRQFYTVHSKVRTTIWGSREQIAAHRPRYQSLLSIYRCWLRRSIGKRLTRCLVPSRSSSIRDSRALRTRAQLPRVALQEPGKKRLWRRQAHSRVFLPVVWLFERISILLSL